MRRYGRRVVQLAASKVATAVSGCHPTPSPPDFPSRIALWRDRLAHKHIQVFLDNAADTELVETLLPGGAGCLVLVTSRREYTDGADLVDLDVLAPDDTALTYHLGVYSHLGAS